MSAVSGRQPHIPNKCIWENYGNLKIALLPTSPNLCYTPAFRCVNVNTKVMSFLNAQHLFEKDSSHLTDMYRTHTHRIHIISRIDWLLSDSPTHTKAPGERRRHLFQAILKARPTRAGLGRPCLWTRPKRCKRRGAGVGGEAAAPAAQPSRRGREVERAGGEGSTPPGSHAHTDALDDLKDGWKQASMSEGLPGSPRF